MESCLRQRWPHCRNSAPRDIEATYEQDGDHSVHSTTVRVTASASSPWKYSSGSRWTPQLDWLTLEVVHISGEAFSAGVERHVVERSVEVQVYSVAKTVADLFKFRNTFGLDV